MDLYICQIRMIIYRKYRIVAPQSHTNNLQSKCFKSQHKTKTQRKIYLQNRDVGACHEQQSAAIFNSFDFSLRHLLDKFLE